jgi:prevent-host-death family protein
MKIATVTELKNGLSAYLDQVKSGETVLVTDRGAPVARIQPVPSSGDSSGRLDRLVRAGFLRPPLAPLPDGFMDGPMVAAPTDGSVVEALLEERQTGR